MVIVPSALIDKWIRLGFANSTSIAAGFKTCFLNEAIDKLTARFSQREKPFPSSLALQLYIENEIRILLKEEENNSLWTPLFSYLKGGNKKLRGLCKQLALLFQRYAVYGSHLTPHWKKSPQGWQEALWVRVFKKWAIASEELIKPISVGSSEDISIHLFAFSHLSFVHLHFFSKLGQSIPVYFYQLSPCQEFWSDIRSDSEARHFFSHHKMSEDLRLRWEELLEERHPFLANLGKVGREAALHIEELGIESIECYENPGANCQLAALQSEILNLQKNKEVFFDQNDQSIQFHSSATPYREVQNLFHFLLGVMNDHRIEPKDILVMAPDIASYVPFIQALFSDKIPYRMTDIPSTKANQQLEGIMLLFALDEKRWSSSILLTLFSHPLFAKRRGWSQDELQTLRQWVVKTGIRWGIDFDHRQQLVDGIMEGGNGTWMQGIDRLFRSLAEPAKEKEWLNYTQADLLAELSLVLQSLREDLAPLQNGVSWPLKEWSHYFQSLNEKYFAHSDEREAFISCCTLLEKIDRAFPSVYSFTTAAYFFNECASEQSTAFNSNTLQSVHFCSLVPMRAIPAKVICLLGMNEGVFPRQEKFRSLDLLQNTSSKDYYPSRSDFDRYLFLEALLSAREIFFVSYLTHSPVDQTESAPATVVYELLSCIKNKQLIDHPPYSFDYRYFDGSNPLLKNYSFADFRAASALYSAPKISSEKNFVMPYQTDKVSQPEAVIIEIEDLIRCVRRPLRRYFHHFLKINFYEEEKILEEEDFVLPSFAFSTLQKEAMKMPLANVLSKFTKEEKWPGGLFREAAFIRIQEQVSSSPHDNQWITLELSCHQENIEKKSNTHWKLPSLNFSHGSKEVQIIGKIEGISKEGLMIFEYNDLKGAVRSWPYFLLFQSLLPSLPISVTPSLIFLRDKIQKHTFFNDQKTHLSRFLDFYFGCADSPSFLFPEWIECILKKEEAKLEKLIDKRVNAKSWGYIPTPELQWLLQNAKHLNAGKIIEKEEANVRSLYGEMNDAWF